MTSFLGNSEIVISVIQLAPISSNFLPDMAEYPPKLLGMMANALLVCFHFSSNSTSLIFSDKIMRFLSVIGSTVKLSKKFEL